MTIHFLSPSRETLHGTFSSRWKPVLTIGSGDSVTAETLDARWSIEAPKDDCLGEQFEPRDPERDTGHALCGPIEIRGAKPGMTLAVHIDALVPATWGWNVAGDHDNSVNERLGLGKGTAKLRMIWDLDPDAGTGTNQFGHTVRLAPFFGVLGMPDASGDLLSTAPPRVTGGNIDCKELVAGSTLFLPIAVEGALFSVGDGHAAQGDGEISGTAIECPMASSRLTLFLRDDLPLTTPIARTPDAWLTFGFHENLDEATLIAIDAMLDLLKREHGIERVQAMALASVVVDLRITQIVNGVRGVHAILRDDAVRVGGASRRGSAA